ncbi:FGGY-family carbohydrate kinase [Herbiconiux sp. L3-i23]|uniref:FGGY-family carbohydrate kinase n=1 Tax=Herbiconiux sp. L3-i23 TaxID=2905871 RepID=UPI00204E45D7|nr:FGGY-family carbohydrate kinase [Herbiconiux sp. L3-i23]BDI22090.1 sugar kinase [Herbiconiux sp. L3-i23]
MAEAVTLGVDIGTSSSKGVLVDARGAILATATREHSPSRPHPGHVEMPAEIWWDEFVAISRDLLAAAPDAEVTAVGVSGMGPCVLVTDEHDEPLRPAILYGVDTRATKQIAALTDRFGADEILERCGSVLTTQAAGPKLAWIRENEPEVWAEAKRLYMPASFLANRLTGAYVLDFHSASQCTPLFDTLALEWYPAWADEVAPGLELPKLVWPADVVGEVTAEAATLTGIPEGTPVVAGTIDAWTEAISVGAQNPGDLMLMYGTTMFLICTVEQPVTTPSMWGTVGAFPGTRNLAGGMATSGAITGWLRELYGSPRFEDLVEEAAKSGPGARGLLMLPYFAGERTPIQDPDARGIVAGLTLSHERGDLYRAALEATALGVRQNVAAMTAAGAPIERIVAVGGGTKGSLWTRIVSDVTGLPQVIPEKTIGASYGAAFLAATARGDVDIDAWNPPAETVEPDPEAAASYDELFSLYEQLYHSTADIAHALAERQRLADS